VAGFLVSGFLMALLGVLLPVWGYHRDPPAFDAVANFFLARRILLRRNVSFLLVSACALSSVSLVYLALVSPPLSEWWRGAGLLALGTGAGLLNMALFHAISPVYRSDAAGTIVRGGIWYGFGCFLATLLVIFYNAPAVLILMASVPAIFGVVYARSAPAASPAPGQPSLRDALRDFRSLGAILFALLLFFQFGNEWSLAGWLPLFLIRRLGLSPAGALFTLALYWLCLMAGRLGAVALLPRLKHGRLLLASGLAALFGCLVLYSGKTPFSAASGVVFIGAGYASIYPLVAEAIGRRFPYYHPGVFNGIFSLALLGGLLAPATVGYAAAAYGVGVAIGIPLAGTCMVVALISLIWLESKVTGR